MNLDISQLSARRIDRIQHAESLDQASQMGIIDRLIDTLFRGGAKKKAIRELFNVISSQTSNVSTQTRAFLDMRSLVLPEHREKMSFELQSQPDGSLNFKMTLNGHEITEGKNIHDEEGMAALLHAKNTIEVDDFLLKLQGNSPKAASFVQRADKFLIEQGKVGDCYLLAAMIGIMSNPAMQEKLEKMAAVTEDGKLKLSFGANIFSRLTNQVNLGGRVNNKKALENENINAILNNENELKNLNNKGYELVRENGTGFQVYISPEKLKDILSELRSAETNSLVVNILEHLAGNFISYTKDDGTPLPGYIEDALRARGKTEQQLANLRADYAQSPSELKSDRESLLAHENRAGEYESLVTTLLGYEGGMYEKPFRSKEPLAELTGLLTSFHKKGLCLASGGARGFVYVGMNWGGKDMRGNFHEGHALTLHDLEWDVDGRPVAVTLINPWDTDKKPARFTLQSLLERRAAFADFLAPAIGLPAPKDPAASQKSDPSSQTSASNIMLFDQFA